MIITRTLVFGPLTLVTAILCSCSSGAHPSPRTAGPVTSASATPATTATSAPAPASTAPVVSPATAARLTAMMLTGADLPAGWTSKPYKSGSNQAADNAAFTKCVGFADTTSHQVAKVHSRTFSMGNATVSSAATSYRTRQDIEADRAGLARPKASACLDKLLRISLNASLHGATVDSVDIKIIPGPGGGPSNVVATESGTTSVTFTASGQHVVLYTDAAFIDGPLIEAEVDLLNVGQRVPAALRAKLIQETATRVARG